MSAQRKKHLHSEQETPTTTRTEAQLVTRSDKGGHKLVTLPRTVTPYRDCVDGTRDHVTCTKLIFVVAPCILIALRPLFVQLMYTNYYKIVKQLKSLKFIIVATICFGLHKPSSGSSQPVLRQSYILHIVI